MVTDRQKAELYRRVFKGQAGEVAHPFVSKIYNAVLNGTYYREVSQELAEKYNFDLSTVTTEDQFHDFSVSFARGTQCVYRLFGGAAEDISFIGTAQNLRQVFRGVIDFDEVVEREEKRKPLMIHAPINNSVIIFAENAFGFYNGAPRGEKIASTGHTEFGLMTTDEVVAFLAGEESLHYLCNVVPGFEEAGLLKFMRTPLTSLDTLNTPKEIHYATDRQEMAIKPYLGIVYEDLGIGKGGRY